LIRRYVAAGSVTFTLVAASPAAAQSPAEVFPRSTGMAAPPGPTAADTRPIIFSPDRGVVELQLNGVALVDGVWEKGWFPVCVGPCAGLAPIAEKYRVGGPNIRNSRVFAIAPGSEPLRLEAKSGSMTGFSFGMAATIVGGIALPAGLFVAGMTGFCGLSNQPGACDSQATTQAIFLSVAGLGAVTLVTGILLLVNNKTVVSGDERPALAAPRRD
jgi:hypothetical protein